jgi:hypothetical protein
MKEDARGKVVETSNKTIPHNSKGDPCFTHLGCEKLIAGDDWKATEPFYTPNSILSQFTTEEIVQLVNRQLYAIEYQRTIHRQRARGEAEKMKELKAKLLEMFHVKWNMCSDEQIEQAAAAIAAERNSK